MSEVLNLLQKRIEEEKESRQLEFKDLNGVIDNLLKQFQVFASHIKLLLPIPRGFSSSPGSQGISSGSFESTRQHRVQNLVSILSKGHEALE